MTEHMEAMDISSDEEAAMGSVSAAEKLSERAMWESVERLCSDLSRLASLAKMHGASESQKVEAASLASAIAAALPHSDQFEAEQVPALLMELRNVPAAQPSMLFRPAAAAYGSRRELVEKFTEEKEKTAATIPSGPAPPVVVATGKSVAGKSGAAMPGAAGGAVCSFCGTQSSPEWRKGPNGPKTLCNACGLVYSKMVKTRKIRKGDESTRRK